MMMRELVATEVQRNFDEYTEYTNEECEEAVERILTDKEWAGDLELNAFCNALHASVLVHTMEDGTYSYGDEDDAERVIELVFLCRNHYEIVCDKEVTVDEEKEGKDLKGQKESKTEQADGNAKGEDEVKRILDDTERIIAHMEVRESSEEGEDEVSLKGLLQSVFLDRNETDNWLMEKGILPMMQNCPKCGSPMRRRQRLADRPDGDFICTNLKCRCRRSGRGNSFFRSLNLSPEIFCEIIVHWLGNDPRDKTAEDADVSERTVSRYRQELRAASLILMQRRNVKIGGKGRVVEVDEALLHRRKYNRGRRKETGWVIGGIERPRRIDERPRMFFEVCPNRKAETLMQIIEKWVLKDSIIVTDCFKSYNNLASRGYHHATVNHKYYFVDPNTAAHTQRIEGMWHWIRVKAMPRSGTNLADMNLHLNAFLYKQFINSSIIRLLQDLATVSRGEIRTLLGQRRAQKAKQKKSTENASSKPSERKRKQIPSKSKQTAPPTAEVQKILKETKFSSPKRDSVMLLPRRLPRSPLPSPNKPPVTIKIPRSLLSQHCEPMQTPPSSPDSNSSSTDDSESTSRYDSSSTTPLSLDSDSESTTTLESNSTNPSSHSQ